MCHIADRLSVFRAAGTLVPFGAPLVLCAVWLAATAILAGQRPPDTAGTQTYVAATVREDGQLVITTGDGRTIVLPKAGGQRAYGNPLVSADGTAVAVQALYPNCCTSYDLPLELVVYSRGAVHRFKGNGLPIFDWHFADAGAHVAYGQQPPHFGCAVHYELREIASERLIDAVDVPQDCGEGPSPKLLRLPRWVSDLREPRR